MLELTGLHLEEHAAAEGRTVEPTPAEWNTEQVVTSLRVTGPVAFKQAIAAGKTEDQALESMAAQMAGSAERLVLAAERDTVMATVESSDEIVGWRRVPDDDPCAWCAMLVSRGAVYKSRGSATRVVGRRGRARGNQPLGTSYHDYCQCTAEPLYEHEDEPAEVDDLYRQWLEVTAGKSGDAALRAWREYWDGRPDRAAPGEPKPVPVEEREPERPAEPTAQPRRDLPVASSFSAWGRPMDANGNAINGPHRDVPTAIRDEIDDIEALGRSGAGFSTVRRAAHEALDRMLSWLSGRPDLLAREAELRDEIDIRSPDRIAELLRDLADDASRPPAESERLDVDKGIQPADDASGEPGLIGSLIPRSHDDADAREDEIGRIIAARLNGEYAGLQVVVTQVEVQKDHLSVHADIRDAAGRSVGTTVRDLYRDEPELFVYHAYLKLNASVQGQGFAEAWNGHLMDWYIESGLDRIEVTANIDVGGYTWARQGFDFLDKDDARNIGSRLRSEIFNNASLYDADQIAAAEALLDRLNLDHDDDRFPTAYEMSQVGRKPGQGKDDKWPGKEAMLGSYWSGVKPVPRA